MSYQHAPTGDPERWLEAVLDRVPTALLLIEPGTARVLHANAAAHDMAEGSFPTGIAAEDYQEVFHCTDDSGRRLSNEEMPGVRAARGERLQGATLNWHTARGVRSLIVSSGDVPATQGRSPMVIVAFQDVSSIKQAGEREQAARREAERIGRRAHFLAEATTVLTSSLDYVSTLETLARLAVPELADWCIVDMLDEAGGIERAAIAHTDPEREARAWEMARRFPSRPGAVEGVPKAIRSGSSELLTDISDDMLERAELSEAQRAMVDEYRLCAAMIVPLKARGQTLGAISFASDHSERVFDAEDLSLAEEFARRAAVTIDNVRLYRSAQEAVARQRRQAHQLLGLTQAWLLINTARSLEEVLRVVTEQARELIGAHRSSTSLKTRNERAQPLTAVSLSDEFAESRGGEDARAAVAAGAAEGPAAAATSTRRRTAAPSAPEAAGNSLSAPLVGRDGRQIGTLELSEPYAGRFSEEDHAVMVQLSHMASIAVENTQLYEERSYIARTLQESLLPSSLPRIPGLELAARYRPAGLGTDVGGDFYDLFDTGSGQWSVVIGDVCGKGADAAAVTALARYTVRAAAMTEEKPSGILSVLNDAILQQREDTRFCTVAYTSLDLSAPGCVGLTVAVGGHPLPLILRADGSVEVFGQQGTLLGIVPSPRLDDRETVLREGDAVVLYTDGVTEAGAPEHIVGVDQLAERLEGCRGMAAGAIARSLEDLARETGTGELKDDLAVLVLRVAGAADGDGDGDGT